MPVVEKYSSQGKAHKISAVPPPEQVFLEVEKVLEPVFGDASSSATAVAPVSAASATTAQPVVLYSKRPSANWVSAAAACHLRISIMCMADESCWRSIPVVC